MQELLGQDTHLRALPTPGEGVCQTNFERKAVEKVYRAVWEK